MLHSQCLVYAQGQGVEKAPLGSKKQPLGFEKSTPSGSKNRARAYDNLVLFSLVRCLKPFLPKGPVHVLAALTMRCANSFQLFPLYEPVRNRHIPRCQHSWVRYEAVEQKPSFSSPFNYFFRISVPIQHGQLNDGFCSAASYHTQEYQQHDICLHELVHNLDSTHIHSHCALFLSTI